MSEKLCVFCKHFSFEHIGTSDAYSEYTGGDDFGGMDCAKKHFFELRPYDTDEFRASLLRAEKCPDYKEAK